MSGLFSMNHLALSTKRNKEILITLKNSKDHFELIFGDMTPHGLAPYTSLACWLHWIVTIIPGQQI